MSEGDPRRTGTVFRVGDDHWFLPATIATRIARLPALTRVPGAPAELVGIAHVDGEILPVLATRGASGSARSASVVVVCAHMGEHVAVAVDEVLHAGTVEVDRDQPDSVRWGEHTARTLDVASLCGRAQRGGWARSEG